MYQVLARKWRPQSFDTLVGQPHIARTLRNAIESGRLHHAYIFSGLRGTGKTSVARILAKCLDCEQGPTPQPCNECTPCREITESRSIDVLEVDAASRTKVDQTRELLETLSYAPVRDRYKILIIDEAHMLSAASFNALLKTLEEPPPRVTFILATTVLQKILPTIRSRCQVLEFRRVGPAELATHLRGICESEEITLSDEALERIARAGDGSIRDALSILERVIAFAGKEVADEDVYQALGSVRTETLVAMVEAIAARDAAAMLAVLDGVIQEGRDLLHFWGELTSVVRDLQVVAAAPDRSDLLSRSADETAELTRAGGDLGAEDLARIFQLLADLEQGLKISGQPRFLFESTLIRIASLRAVRPIEEVLRSLGGTDPSPGGGGSGAPPSAGAPPSGSGPATGGPAARGGNARATAPARGGGRREFLTAIRNGNGLLGSVLSRATDIHRTGNDLLITFTPENETFKRQAESSEYREAIRERAREVYGEPVEIRISTEEAPRQEPAGGDGRAPDGATRPARSGGRPGAGRGDGPNLMETARSHPGVRKLLHEFGAQIMDVRPMEATRPRPEGEDSSPTMEDSG